MGSCISTCRPKSHFPVQEDDQLFNHVQDKLVISSQPLKPPKPITPISPHSNKISPFPSSPSNSNSSASSFSYCTTTTNSHSTISSSSSTLSSSASSVSSISKIDRSFSNEFLWSCYKENPHITRINTIKEAQKSVVTAKLKNQQHPSPLNRGSSVCTKTTPQKRVRASNSPTLKRQKSFRKEPEKPVIPAYTRTLRSPSPSRRFNISDKNRATVMATLPKSTGSNLRPASPNNNISSGLVVRPCLKSSARETQTRIHRITSKIDEVAVREALAHDQFMDCVPAEDMDNPLISLDCFIFL